MGYRNTLRRVLLSSALVACVAAPAVPTHTAAPAAFIAKPELVMGPAATLSNQVASNSQVLPELDYGLFTCQVGEVPGTNCYDPYEIRHAYGTDKLINAGWDGTGKTIVIIDAFQNPNIGLQLSTFDTFYGLPEANFTQIAPQGLTAFDPTNDDMVGWAEEISLDVEWAHAIAPGANIVLVLAKSDQDPDIYAATKYAVDHHLGDVISQSFGEDESCMDPSLLKQQHQMFAEATQKHMTIFASAGDAGAAQVNCAQTAYVKAVSSPAVDPLVTAVGGTSLVAADYTTLNPGAYESESVWNEPDYGSGGGGFSVLYSEPSYQRGALWGGHRGVPDVTYNASVDNGVLTFLDIPGVPEGFYLFGGTSAGSPQWSAITAIADEINRSDLGFINEALYRIAAVWPFYAFSLHDIRVGNNSFGGVTGFAAAPGWDAASGLGSPQAPALVGLLLQYVRFGDGNSEIGQGASMFNNNGHGHMRPH
ncbi:MAG: S53 family peptidase [Steroidobacteraceae bacterium]